MLKKAESRLKLAETLSVILLSLATVLSSWCAFQSSQWSGEQYFRIDDETIANQFRLQMEISASQRQTAHLQMFLEFTYAMSEGDQKFADFLLERMPPELKAATIAWMDTDPINNPDAPASPFEMEEYIIAELTDAKKYAEQAAIFKKKANRSDEIADNYVLFTVILSTVLFFCGIVGITDSLQNKFILLGIAFLIFIGASIFIIGMPVIV
jgi:hypothetical protein